MTMSKYQRIRSALRRFWMIYWPHRTDVLLLAKVPYKGDDNKRLKFVYICAICGKTSPLKDVAVDHIRPCGQFLGPDDEQQFIWNLLFGELQVVCKDPCHKLKTKEERRK